MARYEAGRGFVLAEGDSITSGMGSTDGRSYVQRACALTDEGIEVVDTAVAGATLGAPTDAHGANSLYGRLEDDAQLIGARRRGRPVTLTLLIGRNDLAGYEGGPAAYAENLARYIAQMRVAGADRVIVGTLLPSTFEPFVAPRAALNALLLAPGWAQAHGVDGIVDFAGSPIIGPDGAAAEKKLFGDGTHPTDRGYEVLAPIYAAAVVANAAALTQP